MSASTSSELHPAASELPAGPPHDSLIRRRQGTGAALPARTEIEDATFWARLEDSEEGRVALEADHLFDTSYAWAA